MAGQFSKYAVPGGDLPFYNGTGADIPEGSAVLFDATVAGTQGEPACKLPAAAGGVAGTLGVAINTIKNGTRGLVRMLGSAILLADGSIAAGAIVQASDTAAKMGRAKTAGAALPQLGIALNAATDGNPVHVWIDRAKNA